MKPEAVVLLGVVILLIVLCLGTLSMSAYILEKRDLPKHVKLFAAMALIMSILAPVLFFGSIIYAR